MFICVCRKISDHALDIYMMKNPDMLGKDWAEVSCAMSGQDPVCVQGIGACAMEGQRRIEQMRDDCTLKNTPV